jgi:antitoxin (DNA-binding transcriptional repressor) of toxin-antitoxin stability system
MTTLSAREAQDRLPDLLNQVAGGEEVEITGGDGGVTVRLVIVSRGAARDTAVSEDNPPLSSLRGAGGGKSFSSAEEVDSYVRNLRDEWES